MPVVMIVDDEPQQRQELAALLEKCGYECIVLKNGQEAVDYLLWNKLPAPDVMVLDLFMPGTDGLTVIRALRNTHPHLPIIALSMHGTTRHSEQAIAMGAFDYINKPASSERLKVAIANAMKMRHMERELQQLRPAPSPYLGTDAHSGFSDVWLHALTRAMEESHRDTTLLIEGEEGTGKLTLARAIHCESPRQDKPFITADSSQDIASLHTLLANTRGGTLAVHHDGRAPEEFIRGLERLYHSMTEQNVRLILCRRISRDASPETAVEEFFHKERGRIIHVPALRERPQDILLLTERFLEKAALMIGRSVPALSPATVQYLKTYDWPGNIRELHATLFAALLQSKTDMLEISNAPKTSLHTATTAAAGRPMIPLVNEDGSLRSLEEIESEVIHFALNYFKTSRSDIARMLGIGRTTLYRKAHLLYN